MTGVFTINYPATMAVIDRMTKLVNKLKRINERYESEISTLSRCIGTTENPHNHDSQIASYRKIISNNSKDIVDLGLLISQIFSLMVNTKMTDFYLTQLIRNLMSGDSNVPNPKTSVIGESLSEQAAKKAGVRVDSRGVPIINNGTDAKAYMDALNNLTKIYVFPVPGGTIGDKFGCDCYAHKGNHNGIDIKSAGVSMPIVASAKGKVEYTYTSESYGNLALVSYGDYLAIYAHMEKECDLSIGQEVNPGDEIGMTGNTGKSYGTHLHFGLAKEVPIGNTPAQLYQNLVTNKYWVDPMEWGSCWEKNE